MPNFQEQLIEEIEALEYQTKSARTSIQKFNQTNFTDLRNQAAIYCLNRAVEIAESCAVLAKSKLFVPLGLLNRGLLECLMWTCWIIESEENAKYYQELSINEAKRIMKKAVQSGHGKAIDKKTGEDKSEEFLKLEKMQKIPKRVRIEEIADKVGLGKLYTQLYMPLSLEVHGSNFGIEEQRDSNAWPLVSIMAATAQIFCINLVVVEWTNNKKKMSAKDIYKTLGT